MALYIIITLSTCPIIERQKLTDFLHHNQIFDVIITFFNYDIQNLISMHGKSDFYYRLKKATMTSKI